MLKRKVLFTLLMFFVSMSALAANYLTFVAGEAMTISLSNKDIAPNLEYSLDGGSSWVTWNYSAINLTAGKKVMFRGNNSTGFNQDETHYSKFVLSGEAAASGSVMSLIDGTGDSKVIPSGFCFARLFENCEYLTSAPELPATTLTDHCYFEMFFGCENITSAPTLPAETLAPHCYDGMFKKCYELVTAPVLPAMVMADYCYNGMFQNCISLTVAPALPATTLAPSCYRAMFYGCTALKAAPELLATTLVDGCYLGMFEYCSSLKYVKVGFTNWEQDSNCTLYWLNGVSTVGLFDKPSDLEDLKGTNYIPGGWDVLSLETEITDSICYNESYVFGSQVLKKSGTYKETFVSSGGSDSVVTLTLFVSPMAVLDTIRDTIQAGESYLCPFNGKTYTTQTVMYKDTVSYSYGCDSLITYHMLIVVEDNPRIMYVMQTKRGKGDGSSWANATDNVGYAIKKLSTVENGQNNQVWVADGTFGKLGSYPIYFRGNVSVYGGFAGVETSIEQREKVAGGEEWEFVHQTIFSGGDTMYCARYYDAKNATETMYIDGITFEHGYFAGATYAAGVSLRGKTIFQNCIVRNNLREDNPLTTSSEYGAGIYASKGVTIKNCLIENNVLNTVTGYGAGLYATGGATMENVVVQNNTLTTSAAGSGAGVYVTGGLQITDAKVLNNTLTATTNGYGAGMYVSGVYQMSNVVVSDNVLNATGYGYGAGLYLKSGDGASSILSSTLTNNTGANYGGAIYHYNSATSTLTLEKCRIYGNSSQKTGSVIYDKGAYASTSIVNSLIYNNGGNSYALYLGVNKLLNNTIANNQGYTYIRFGNTSSNVANNIVWGAPTASHAKIHGSSSLTDLPVHNNATQSAITVSTWNKESNYVINASNTHVAGPNFVAPTSFKGAPSSAAEAAELPNADWSLMEASLCVNNGATVAEAPTDIIGVTRPQHDNYDIGAYEYEGEILSVTLTLLVNNSKYGSAMTSDSLTVKTYAYGEDAEFSATPKLGYVFKNWSDGSEETHRVVTMTSNLALTATFVSIKDTVFICPSELPYTHNFVSSTGTTTVEYATIGTKTVKLKSIAGVDSVATLVLKEYKTYSFEEQDTIILPDYTWHGHLYTGMADGDYVYYDSLFTEQGCDSVYTLYLHVENKPVAGKPLDIVDWTDHTIMVNLVGQDVNAVSDAVFYLNGSVVPVDYIDNNDNTVTLPYTYAPCESVFIELENAQTAVMLSSAYYKIPFVVMTSGVISDLNPACDLWINNGATATIASNETVRNAVICSNATLAVEKGASLTADTLMIKSYRDENGRLEVLGTVNLAQNTLVYAKNIKDKGLYYLTSLPYSCNRSQVRLSTGATPSAKQLLLYTYDGQARANGASGCWASCDELTPNVGFEFGTNTAKFREFRFPMTVAQLTYESTASILLNNYVGSAPNDTYFGWNLVGLPYTSEKPIGTAISHDGNSDIYVSLSNVDQKTYTQDLSSKVAIAPFQSFFIQATATDNAIVGNALSARYAPSRDVQQQEAWLRLALTRNDLVDFTTIRVHDSYSSSFDRSYDLTKMVGYAALPQLYSFAGAAKMAFSAVPEEDMEQPIHLGVYIPEPDLYFFSLDRERCKGLWDVALLYDAETNQTINLLREDYWFVASEGTFDERFTLQARMREPSNIASSEENLMGGIKVVPIDGGIYVEGLEDNSMIRVYDSAGRLVSTTLVRESVSLNLPSAGVYLLQVYGLGGIETIKVINNK